jgi:hypothetical protein
VLSTSATPEQVAAMEAGEDIQPDPGQTCALVEVPTVRQSLAIAAAAKRCDGHMADGDAEKTVDSILALLALAVKEVWAGGQMLASVADVVDVLTLDELGELAARAVAVHRVNALDKKKSSTLHSVSAHGVAIAPTDVAKI